MEDNQKNITNTEVTTVPDDKEKEYLFEPIMIYLGNEEWEHPDIASMCQFGEKFDDGEESPYEVGQSFRFWVDFADDTSMYAIVKSSILKEYWSQYEMDENDNYFSTTGGIVSYTFGNKVLKEHATDFVRRMIVSHFIKDLWVVGGKTFVSTTLGEKISSKFCGDWKFFYSPDVAVWRDKDTGTYGYDT